MRRLLLICAATLFTLAIVGFASATGPQNQFAAGSAKTETTTFVTNEHVSFDVHNVRGGLPCEAFGRIVYKSAASVFLSGAPLEFEARLTRLVINNPGTYPVAAWFAGPIKIVKQGPQDLVGSYAGFSAIDSGLGGGMSDAFAHQTLGPNDPGCDNPLFGGHAIDQGNIIIKATGPLLP